MDEVNKKTVVVHSGGMDSSLCLALAIEKYRAPNVLSLSFTYGQRHSNELERAKKICADWKVDHKVIDLSCLNKITKSALMDTDTKIEHKPNSAPNTLVVGRNGLMARIAAIHANSLGASSIYMGVIEVEEANSGYRDCSRSYMDIIQAALRVDFADSSFEIKTPLVYMTKKQTMELGYQLGHLHYLLDNTISCYEGISGLGCQVCPACKLRNEGIQDFLFDNSDFVFSYRDKFSA